MGKRDRLIKITVAENRNTYVQIKEEKGSELCARIMGNATITDIGMLLLERYLGNCHSTTGHILNDWRTIS